MTTPSIIARHLLVSGRVQGVWFRQSTFNEATRLGVFGWVSNLEDGRVEVFVEGPADKVEALVDLCRRGPPLAVVDAVDIQPAEPTGLTSFEFRR